jgi:hypothetical protein
MRRDKEGKVGEEQTCIYKTKDLHLETTMNIKSFKEEQDHKQQD